MRTSKTTAKRFKLTGSKKITHRYCGQDHFRSRKSGVDIMRTHKERNLSKTLKKTIRTYINK